MSDEQSRPLNDNQMRTNSASQSYDSFASSDKEHEPGDSNLKTIPDGFTAVDLSEPGQDTSHDSGGSNSGTSDTTGGDTEPSPGDSNLKTIPDGFTAVEPNEDTSNRDPRP